MEGREQRQKRMQPVTGSGRGAAAGRTDTRSMGNTAVSMCSRCRTNMHVHLLPLRGGLQSSSTAVASALTPIGRPAANTDAQPQQQAPQVRSRQHRLSLSFAMSDPSKVAIEREIESKRRKLEELKRMRAQRLQQQVRQADIRGRYKQRNGLQTTELQWTTLRC